MAAYAPDALVVDCALKNCGWIPGLSASFRGCDG